MRWFRGANNVNLGDGLAQATRLGDRVFFAGADTGSNTGLWVTDGTASGTTEIGGIGDASGVIDVGPDGLKPTDITDNGPDVLFSGEDKNSNDELWMSDGTAAGTVELSGGLTGEASTGLDPTDIVSLGNGIAVFIGHDSNDNDKPTLWVTNGTRAGTEEIGNLNNADIPDANAANGLTPQIDTLMGGDGIAYFTASSTDGTQTSVLWETDGTANGTKVVPGTDVDSIGLIPQNMALGPVPAADDSFTTAGQTIALANEPGEEVNLSNSTAASPDVVTGSNGTINLIAAAVATIIGGGNLISSLGKSNSVTLKNTNGNKDTVSTGATATKGAITLSGAQALVEGQYDTVTFASGTTGNILYVDNPFSGSIAGFAVGDTIDFLNVPYATSDYVSFVGNGSQSGGTLTIENASGTAVASLTIQGNYNPSQFGLVGLNGELALVGAAGVAHVAANDFNGDGASDLLWRNASGGVVVWDSNGSGGFTSKSLGTFASAWRIEATGDFNGVGKAGLLLRNVNGAVQIKVANGTGGFISTNLGVMSRAVQIEGVGDFNGDHETDILLRNRNGEVEVWDSNGTGGGFTAIDLGVASNALQIAGVGDFNGDGEADILWRNVDGDAVIWESNGSGGFTNKDLGVISSSWQIAGIGDFNGDGKADILLHKTNGDTQIWESNGSGGFTAKDLGVVSTAWQIAGVDDFNGDGKSDILWRNTNGDTMAWEANASGGFTAKSFGDVASTWQPEGNGVFIAQTLADIFWVNTSGAVQVWDSNGAGGFTTESLGTQTGGAQIAGIGDFNGDGKLDILWRKSNGDTALWDSNGAGGFTGQDLGVVSTAWQVAGVGDFNGDGEADILWRNTNGTAELWDSNGSGGFTSQELGRHLDSVADRRGRRLQRRRRGRHPVAQHQWRHGDLGLERLGRLHGEGPGRRVDGLADRRSRRLQR